MKLKKYREKRDFNKTAEPQTGKSRNNTQLQFVIQKHAASHLHYDFRLEMKGVLKSWAIPKGPSTDPKVKRLAMMVEDHPFDYKDFEGTIPKGEYGGGTVMVWDHGTYAPIAKLKGKRAQENHLLKALNSGSLKIILHGKKLKGEFALVKTKGMAENSWLLIKHADEFASSTEVIKKDKSVLSDRTLEQVAKSSNQAWENGEVLSLKKRKSSLDETELLAEKTRAKKSPVAIQSLLKKGHTSKAPIGMKPMLATLVDQPFDDPNWLYEVKWDGYRALAFCSKDGKVELRSRNNTEYTEKFYPIHHVLSTWKMDIVLDGELVVLNKKGISTFSDLQNWRNEADGTLVYYVFDILWYQGKDVSMLPLKERKSLLEALLPQQDDRVRLSQVFTASGIDFFDAASKMGLEGIVAKKSQSKYKANTRTKEWLKIKIKNRQDVVIAGYTKNEGTSKLFSSLLLGAYEGENLQYIGKVGTGFKEKEQREMMSKFKPLVSLKSPFVIPPDANSSTGFQSATKNTEVTWLNPTLVGEVAFTEITSEGIFRHPSFKGMRMDKEAKEVTRDAAIPFKLIVQNDHLGDLNTDPVHEDEHEQALGPPKANGGQTLLNPMQETQTCTINGHDLTFTHLSKLYWPEDQISKRDVLNYYYQMAEYILPYLNDRPMSLNRFPGGIHGKHFYQKDVKKKAPFWAKTYPYTTSEGEQKEYLLGNDEAALLWMASLGCIEMNPWFSRSQSPSFPDYCVIDLDPDKNTFDQVIQVAQLVKEVLDQLQVESYVKTSGSTGMHIYIPLAAKYTYTQSQLFAELIVNLVHRQVPDFTSLERTVSKRKGKMYLDFLQNRPGATIAGPYSLRPKPGAPVSMPLAWDEVKPGLRMLDFTLFNALDRLKQKGDLFKGVLGKGIDLEKVVNRAKNLLK